MPHTLGDKIISLLGILLELNYVIFQFQKLHVLRREAQNINYLTVFCLVDNNVERMQSINSNFGGVSLQLVG